MNLSFVYPNALWFLLLIPLTIGLALLGPRRPNKRRFWVSLIARTLLLTALVLAIAGIQLRLKTESLTTVFLLDASDSVPIEEQDRGENIIRTAVSEMPSGDRAAIVVFGEDALVERLASEDSALNDLSSIPISTRTDIASALQLAIALFPNEGAKRIVLLSDGQENLGYALEQAELVSLQQIELLYVALSGLQSGTEVLLESLEAPGIIRQGEQLQLVASVNASQAVSGILQIFSDSQLIHSQEVNLSPGTSKFVIPVETDDPNTYTYRAQIIPSADGRLQNNEASAIVVVEGPPNILIVENTPGDATNLIAALQSSEMILTATTPEGMPSTLQSLVNYDAVILVNTPAGALPSGILNVLQVYVRDQGKGLIMTGGQRSFGAGGYLRTPLEEALPVDMDVRSKENTPNLALILAIDKSGSMGRCHCDDPDLNQTYTRQEVGQPKVDIAKEAVMRAASALGSEDYMGVVAFDADAKWAFEASKLLDYSAIEQAIGGIVANGDTNLQSGVTAAYDALTSLDAKRKHIILLTDGWTQTGDLSPLVQSMESEGITLSVIAAGGGSAEYLQGLAEDGGGRYYPAENILNVPDLFLKETVTSVGEYIIEEPFYPLPSLPGPALRGIDTLNLPVLRGYNGTTVKNSARLDLLTPKGDPLLASWQYGRGRSAAWTSDLTGHWAADWVAWEDFARFASQLVSWVLPTPLENGFVPKVFIEDNEGVIQLIAEDENGRPVNDLDVRASITTPDLESFDLSLEQINPGQYEVRTPVTQPGTYIITMGVNDQDYQSNGSISVGLVVPYSPEYKAAGVDLARLIELAQITGGGELNSPEAAFLHNLPGAAFAKEIWRPIILLVAILFPLDVALRRLVFSQKEVQDAKTWVRALIPFRKPQSSSPDEPKVLGSLFEARNRARSRRSAESDQDSPSKTQPTVPAPIKDKPVTQNKAQSDKNQPSADTFSRLKAAKKRTQKGSKEE